MVAPGACSFLAGSPAARNLQAPRGSIGTDIAEIAAEMDLSWARLPPVSDPALAGLPGRSPRLE
jgi:hypothetical protein